MTSLPVAKFSNRKKLVSHMTSLPIAEFFIPRLASDRRMRLANRKWRMPGTMSLPVATCEVQTGSDVTTKFVRATIVRVLFIATISNKKRRIYRSVQCRPSSTRYLIPCMLLLARYLFSHFHRNQTKCFFPGILKKCLNSTIFSRAVAVPVCRTVNRNELEVTLRNYVPA